MDKTKIAYIVLVVMALVVYFITMHERSSNEAERDSEYPSADDIYREQGSIDQDMSLDSREDDFERSGRTPDPVLIPDMSHILSREAIPEPDGFSVSGVYTGTVPCADCAGIEMELKLLTNPSSGHQRYILKQTYMATREGNRVFWESGPWEMGSTADGSRLLRLSRNETNNHKSFTVESERVIRLLDQREEPIQSRHNYSLYRLPQ